MTDVHGPRISNEPIVNFAFRWMADLAFALFVLSIIYMSFVPFDLALSRPDKGWRAGRVILGLATSPFNLPDILANIAYYVPISTLGFFVLRRRIGWLAATLVILIAGSAMSFGVEFAQQWTHSRVSSWADFAANTVGLVLGLGLAFVLYPFARLCARGAGEAISSDPLGSAAKLLACMLIVIHARPLDIATDIPRTVLNTVRHGDFSPTARWNMLNGADTTKPNINFPRTSPPTARMRQEYVLDQAATAAGYGLLACLIGLSMRRQGSTSFAATLAWSGFVTLSLAAIITGLRILMLSHGLDTAHMLCGVAGWLLGVTASVSMMRGMPPISRNDRMPAHPGVADIRMLVGSRWLPAASIAVGLCVVAYELIPFDFSASAASSARASGRIILVPLSGQFAGSVPNLVADLSGKFLRYAALAVCCVGLMPGHARMRWRWRALVVTIATGAIVSLLQLVHLFQLSRTCDITNVFIATGAAGFAAVLLRALRDLHRASPRLVDDLLTRQLIEGESFDKNALTALRKRRSGAFRKEEAQAAPRD